VQSRCVGSLIEAEEAVDLFGTACHHRERLATALGM
jgi:hypothetical protein